MDWSEYTPTSSSQLNRISNFSELINSMEITNNSTRVKSSKKVEHISTPTVKSFRELYENIEKKTSNSMSEIEIEARYCHLH